MMVRPARLLALIAALLLMASVGEAAAAPTEDTGDSQLLLLLDASGSMEDPDAQGQPKIDAARAALRAVVDGLGPAQSAGLRVFGGSVTLDRPMEQKCTDSELVVPVGTGNAEELSAAVDDYAPLGETPIAYALQQAAHDLGTEGNRTVVLVSDGIATCDPDPCEVAAQLTADGLDLVVHTVGLGADEETRTQLRCIAEAGGGSYYDATDAETLTTALTRLSTRAFRPFVYSGTPVTGTPEVDDAPELASGQYTDTVSEDALSSKHYAIPRTQPGSRIFVGATMRNARPSGASGVTLSLTTPDGTLCGVASMPVFSIGMQSSFGTAGAATPATGSPECTRSETLVLALEPVAGSPQILGEPLEIVVEELPPVTDEAVLPGPSDDPHWSGLTAGEPTDEVVGGVSPSAATPLEPGQTVSFDLVPGEIVFFSVPVDFGQGLEALVHFPGVDGQLAQEMRPTGDALELALVAPHRAQVHDVLADTGMSYRALLEGPSPAQAAVVMPEVRWANTASQDPAVAGDHVVMVSLASTRERLVPLPLTLTTNVVGEVSGVPEHASADAARADNTLATAEDTDVTAAPTRPSEAPTAAGEPDDGTDGLTWLAWLLAAGGVLVAGAGAVLLARRRSG